MLKQLVFFITVLFTSIVLSQNKPAYKIFNNKGRKVSYGKMIKKIDKTSVVLFGEYHNNPIVHWLQLEVVSTLNNTKSITLGAEMIEADNQQQLNNYLLGVIDDTQFNEEARLWKNYATDYKPLVDFAKNNNLKFIATNIPRSFASLVYKNGFEALDELSENEQQFIAPLPIKYNANLPGYVKMIEMMGGHGGDNLPKAQAIKDATMAHFILKNLEKNKIFIHFNGSYHSDNYEGIYWYLKQQNPNLNVATISIVEQNNLKKLQKEDKLKADFIIVVPTTMTKTY